MKLTPETPHPVAIADSAGYVCGQPSDHGWCYCGIRHAGAAFTPGPGWHDFRATRSIMHIRECQAAAGIGQLPAARPATELADCCDYADYSPPTLALDYINGNRNGVIAHLCHSHPAITARLLTEGLLLRGEDRQYITLLLCDDALAKVAARLATELTS